MLEFDHVGPKLAGVSYLVSLGARPTRLDEEFQRCEVVCVNCHRKRTAARRTPAVEPVRARYVARNLAFVRSVLAVSVCADCETAHVAILEFDHVAGTKRDSVSSLALHGHALEVVREEIAKCEIRCGNCHRRRTAMVEGYFRHHLGGRRSSVGRAAGF